MDELLTERSFASQAMLVIGVLHWRTSSCLEQELNVCTVRAHDIWVVTGRAVEYYAWSAHAFIAGIKCWHFRWSLLC